MMFQMMKKNNKKQQKNVIFSFNYTPVFFTYYFLDLFSHYLYNLVENLSFWFHSLGFHPLSSFILSYLIFNRNILFFKTTVSFSFSTLLYTNT